MKFPDSTDLHSLCISLFPIRMSLGGELPAVLAPVTPLTGLLIVLTTMGPEPTPPTPAAPASPAVPLAATRITLVVPGVPEAAVSWFNTCFCTTSGCRVPPTVMGALEAGTMVTVLLPPATVLLGTVDTISFLFWACLAGAFCCGCLTTGTGAVCRKSILPASVISKFLEDPRILVVSPLSSGRYSMPLDSRSLMASRSAWLDGGDFNVVGDAAGKKSFNS